MAPSRSTGARKALFVLLLGLATAPVAATTESLAADHSRGRAVDPSRSSAAPERTSVRAHDRPSTGETSSPGGPARASSVESSSPGRPPRGKSGEHSSRGQRSRGSSQPEHQSASQGGSSPGTTASSEGSVQGEPSPQGGSTKSEASLQAEPAQQGLAAAQARRPHRKRPPHGKGPTGRAPTRGRVRQTRRVIHPAAPGQGSELEGAGDGRRGPRGNRFGLNGNRSSLRGRPRPGSCGSHSPARRRACSQDRGQRRAAGRGLHPASTLDGASVGAGPPAPICPRQRRACGDRPCGRNAGRPTGLPAHRSRRRQACSRPRARVEQSAGADRRTDTPAGTGPGLEQADHRHAVHPGALVRHSISDRRAARPPT